MQLVVVNPYRRFGTTYRSNPHLLRGGCLKSLHLENVCEFSFSLLESKELGYD